jgi:ADP-ribosylglycohydrolase
MIGAIVGDIVGSVYEFDNIKTKDFELFKKECEFTDDSVLTIAVAETLMECEPFDDEEFKELLIDVFHEYGEMYPDVGYGGNYLYWVEHKNREPYNSCGNGCGPVCGLLQSRCRDLGPICRTQLQSRLSRAYHRLWSEYYRFGRPRQ